MSQQTLNQMVGQNATITGVARDAHLGAVVVTDDRTPVYIDGLRSWPGSASGKRVHATGLLRHRPIAPEPVIGADGGISHGVTGANYVLESATWVDAP